jgi:hypothetical protein
VARHHRGGEALGRDLRCPRRFCRAGTVGGPCATCCRVDVDRGLRHSASDRLRSDGVSLALELYVATDIPWTRTLDAVEARTALFDGHDVFGSLMPDLSLEVHNSSFAEEPQLRAGRRARQRSPSRQPSLARRFVQILPLTWEEEYSLDAEFPMRELPGSGCAVPES